jgi:hypothetical protein
MAVAGGYVSPFKHIAEPGVVPVKAEGVSQHKINPGWILAAVDLKEASRARVRALFKLTNTIEARMPMMAITMRSSIRVNPFVFFI